LPHKPRAGFLVCGQAGLVIDKLSSTDSLSRESVEGGWASAYQAIGSRKCFPVDAAPTPQESADQSRPRPATRSLLVGGPRVRHCRAPHVGVRGPPGQVPTRGRGLRRVMPRSHLSTHATTVRIRASGARRSTRGSRCEGITWHARPSRSCVRTEMATPRLAAGSL